MVEQKIVNLLVVGSNPTRGAPKIRHTEEVCFDFGMIATRKDSNLTEGVGEIGYLPVSEIIQNRGF